MKTLSFALLGLMLIACGQKPGTGSDTGGSVADADNDGFDSSVDCDDSNADINPDADEICDGLDNNCDGVRDEDTAVDAPSWYADSDSDTYGDASISMSACEAPEGYVTDSSDCDDSDAAINPDTTWYADADSDGHGDAGASQQSCEQPSGFVATSGDCNDSDAQINPDAVEICDGMDNDCDTSTSEDSMVSYVDSSGNAVDVTADVSGPPAGPQAYTLSDGELQFCDGTFYTHLLIDGDAAIRSVNEDPTQAILDGGGKGRTVTVVGEALNVAIEDLKITGGAGSADDFSFDGVTKSAGGLACLGVDSDSGGGLPETFTDLSLENVLLVGNTADSVGGMFTIWCNLDVSNSEISDNSANNNGAFVAFDGDHQFTGVDILNNAADAYAVGGISGWASPATAIFDDVIVSGNVSSDSSFVFGVLYDTTMTWSGTSGSMGSGIWGNDAPGGSALELADDTDFTASSLDFGSMADGTGNLDLDIDLLGFEYWVNRDDASFICLDGVCGNSITTTIVDPSAATNNNPSESTALGAVFTVDSLGTLDEFSLYTKGETQSCIVDYSLLSSSNPAGGSWTLEWQSTQTIGSKLSWHESGPIGKVLDSSLTYALHWDTNDCDYDLSWNTGVSASVPIVGLGEVSTSYVFFCSDGGSIGDTVTCIYDTNYPVQFSLRVDVTEI